MGNSIDKRDASEARDARYILGLDVGGANTKFALVQFPRAFPGEGPSASASRSAYPGQVPLAGGKSLPFHVLGQGIEYFPVWERTRADLPAMLAGVRERTRRLVPPGALVKCAVSVTAELSDVFATKREGVLEVVAACESAFPGPLHVLQFLSVKGTFLAAHAVKETPLAVAAANWVATALLVGKFHPDALLVDMGSTTTDLIPIQGGQPATRGLDDTSRLVHHELLYTGILRATIPSVAHQVPYRGGWCPVSFEKFALMADAYLVLGDITPEQYTCDTADGRSPSRANSLARLARVICADLEGVTEPEVLAIARYLKERQLAHVLEAIYAHERPTRPPGSNAEPRSQEIPCRPPGPVILTGIGAPVLREAVRAQLPFPVEALGSVLPRPDHLNASPDTISTAVAVAVCLAMESARAPAPASVPASGEHDAG